MNAAGSKDLVKMRRFKRSLKLREYDSLLDTLRATFTVKKMCGLTVFELRSAPEHSRITSKFSPRGLVIFTVWVSLYYFSAYRIFSEDQSILRALYNTRLKHYGDVFERIVSTVFVSYVFWKIPFDTSLRPKYIEKLLDIDDIIEGMGVKIDHGKDARKLLTCCLLQLTIGLVRLFSVWIMLSHLNTKTPKTVLLQASVTNVIALIVTAHYCSYVHFIQNRHKIINNVLAEIKSRKSWEQIVLVRSKQPMNMQKVWNYQDKYLCEKIRNCARIYGLLFNAVESVTAMYGFALLCTLSYCVWYIVLYLFYFMEATASGLFHDMQSYAYFLIDVFWQIFYGVGVIFLNVYFADSAVTEAGRASYIVHEIINSDISPPVTTEAMQFSLQLLHQIPVFTAWGLCKIDYTLILQLFLGLFGGNSMKMDRTID